MKKVLIIFTTLMLTLTAVCSFGCAKANDIFEGKFIEINQEQMEEIVDKVEEAEKRKGYVFDFKKGAEVKAEIERKHSGVKEQMSFSLNTLTKDGKNHMKGSVSFDLEGKDDDKKANMWYKDQAVYAVIDSFTGGVRQTVKVKEEDVNVDKGIDALVDEIDQIDYVDYSLTFYLEEFKDCEQVKFFSDNGKQNKKIKMELPKTTLDDGSELTMKVTFLYDKDYNVTDIEYDIKSRIEEDGVKYDYDVDITVKTSDEKISYPDEIDDASAWNTDLDVLKDIFPE